MATATLKCIECKQRFPRETMTKLNAGNFHSVDCIAKYATKKQHAKSKKEFNKKHKEDKERIKTRTEWYDQLQSLVNQYVLHIRDKSEPCCTCGKTTESVKYDAGHFKSRGSCPELRFELTNIHKQCSFNCNQIGSGMRAEYIEFIRAKYGQEHLDWLEGTHKLLKDQFPHYTDIKNEIIRYRKIIREHGLTPRA